MLCRKIVYTILILQQKDDDIQKETKCVLTETNCKCRKLCTKTATHQYGKQDAFTYIDGYRTEYKKQKPGQQKSKVQFENVQPNLQSSDQA